MGREKPPAAMKSAKTEKCLKTQELKNPKRTNRYSLKSKLFLSPIPKKGNAKECSHYCTIVLISHASKVMFKIFQVRLQQYVNPELPDVKLDLEKAEEPDIKLTTSTKKSGESRKTSLTKPKPLPVWITTNCGKFFKRYEYQTTLPAS